MSFTYFAYGSNMWLPQMRKRCPSARPVGQATLSDWLPAYCKPGADGSAKLSINHDAGAETRGVLYEIANEERPSLDAAEPGYDAIEVTVVDRESRPVDALTYVWTKEWSEASPHSWYVSMAREGARQAGIPSAYYGNHLSADEPMIGGLRAAGEEDLIAMQSIISRALTVADGRFTPHPGDLAWWMWHPDPRPHVHNDSFWLLDDRAVDLHRLERAG